LEDGRLTIGKQLGTDDGMLFHDIPFICIQLTRFEQDLVRYAEFAYVNILEHPEIREGLKVYSNWPTFPQLYVKGELIGGCDIAMEMYQNGELKTLLADVAA